MLKAVSRCSYTLNRTEGNVKMIAFTSFKIHLCDIKTLNTFPEFVRCMKYKTNNKRGILYSNTDRAMRKRVSGHMRTAKAKIRPRGCAV